MIPLSLERKKGKCNSFSYDGGVLEYNVVKMSFCGGGGKRWRYVRKCSDKQRMDGWCVVVGKGWKCS